VSFTQAKCDAISWLAGLADTDPVLQEVLRVMDSLRLGEAVVLENRFDAGRALNLLQASRRAGVSRPTLYRALKAGALRSFTPYAGGNQLIPEGELARWMSVEGAKS